MADVGWESLVRIEVKHMDGMVQASLCYIHFETIIFWDLKEEKVLQWGESGYSVNELWIFVNFFGGYKKVCL